MTNPDSFLAASCEMLHRYLCIKCEDTFTVQENEYGFVLTCGCQEVLPLNNPESFQNPNRFAKYVASKLVSYEWHEE